MTTPDAAPMAIDEIVTRIAGRLTLPVGAHCNVEQA